MKGQNLKQISAEKAVELHVRSGMTIGLGTGSTVEFAIHKIGKLIKAGDLCNIVGVPTSAATQSLAKDLQIPLACLDDVSKIDIAIDGADEVDSDLNLVKGRGGALLQEKMVEQFSSKFVVIVDNSKMQTKGLGTSGPLPVEIIKHNWRYIRNNIKQLKSLNNLSSVELRTCSNEAAYVTDNGNNILNLLFSAPIVDPKKAADDLKSVVGVVDHGLFLGMADEVIVANLDGTVDIKRRV